jgi:peptide/nickel transport system substrate-binding protein
MKKYTVIYLVLAIILVLGLTMSGCAKTETTTPSAPPATIAPATTTPVKTIPPSSAVVTTPPATSAAAPTSAPQQGGILTMISPNAPTIFGYPVKAGAGFASILSTIPVLESLIDSDIHGNIRGKLAESWETAPDKSSITFKLRKGVKFHDGSDFNAQVLKWNLDLFLQRGTGSPADWKSVEVIDDHTLRINLKNYKNTQLSNMTYAIISKAAVDKNGADWAGTNPVGTGPFKFKSSVPNTSLEYERFDGYWGDKARVDGIKFIYIVDATTASMAYQAGDALVWESADPKTAFNLTKQGYQRFSRRGPIMNLVPDSANPDSPFAKKEVRQAVEYAIDRQAIVDALGYGAWEVVYQPNVPEQFGYVPDLVGRKYDPAKAKQLLAQAGYPNGFATKIITSVAFAKDPLVAIQDNLAAVGITTTIDVQAAAKWAETRTTGWNNGLFYVTHGATDYNYCAYLERYFTPTSTFAAKSIGYPPGWVDLINKMMLTAAPAEMADLAKQAVRVEVDNVLEIPLWVQAEVYVADKSVHDMGVGTHGDGFTWDTNKVWISK